MKGKSAGGLIDYLNSMKEKNAKVIFSNGVSTTSMPLACIKEIMESTAFASKGSTSASTFLSSSCFMS